MRVVRRAAVLWVAAVILLAAASAPAFGDTAAGAACGRACGQPPTLTRSGSTSPVESCIHNPGCGGGGASTTSTTTTVAACTTGATVAVCALAIRRHRDRRTTEPTGSLLASRLFHPPRFVLGS